MMSLGRLVTWRSGSRQGSEEATAGDAGAGGSSPTSALDGDGVQSRIIAGCMHRAPTLTLSILAVAGRAMDATQSIGRR